MHLLYKVGRTTIVAISIAVTLPYFSCNKLIEINPPDDSITIEKAFRDSINASSSINGIYAKLLGAPLGFGNGQVTQLCGLYSDELRGLFDANNSLHSMQESYLTAKNNDVYLLWAVAYFCIYQANSCIEALPNSTGISESFRDQLIGEALFFRAWCYYYLVNLYGDVPFVLTTDFKETRNLPKSKMEKIFVSLANDLVQSKKLMTYGYSHAKEEKTRVTPWASAALLSRIYLNLGNWKDAELEATWIIEHPNLFNLTNKLTDVFLKNSPEAILQWHINEETSDLRNLTFEGYLFNPNPYTGPEYYLAQELLNSFEPGDNRKNEWVDSTLFNNLVYYYPRKYRTGLLQYGEPTTEYYMILRLGEQYLIRSEARAQQGKIEDAVNDLNMIRQRAMLTPVAQPTSKEELLKLILKERRIELAYEWGCRFFDLKRFGVIDSVMGKLKTRWEPFRKKFPIPSDEIRKNPSLIQNDGYSN